MKNVFALVCSLLACCNIFAQDAQLTQYFTSPMMLNPAFTGLIGQDVRACANYRSQWSNISPNPYTTLSLSADAPILRGRLPKGNAMGLGVQGLYDKTGSGLTINKSIGVCISYHKAIGSDSTQHISLGAQVMSVNKRVDFGLLSVRVPARYAHISYADYGAGVSYSRSIRHNASFYIGYALYHITQPIEVYLGTDLFVNRMRHVASAGGSTALGKRVALYANGIYGKQGYNDIALGSYVSFWLNPKSKNETKTATLYLGGWYRYQDAVSPYVGIEWSKMRIGISYDVNISSFTPATRSNGAYEISLIYFGRINKRERNPNYNWSCPKLY